MATPENRRLSSWKQIARYLGRDQRTVMRWEKRWGMPVRRPGGADSGSTVYAYTAELDAWLEREGPGAGHGQNGAEEPAEGDRPAGRRMLGRLGALAALGALALLGFLGVTRFGGPPLPPSRVSAVGDVMTVFRVDGSVAWTFKHPDGFSFQQPGLTSRAVDLDGDGAPEVLVNVNTVNPSSEALVRVELYEFGSDQRLGWRVVPTDSLQFGGALYGPRWASGSLDVVTLNGATRIVYGVHDPTWWPSMVLILSPDGEEVGRFVNSGWVLDSGALARSEGDLLVVGGISNSHGGAMLALLDPQAPYGTSPEAPGTFSCETCASGHPLRYFVFGPSHVNRASGLPYGRTVGIETSESGFKAVVMEGRFPSEAHWVYEFSNDLELVRATPSDTYWPEHERLRVQGLIDHTEEACPERGSSPPVSVWSPEEGWRVLHVPEGT